MKHIVFRSALLFVMIAIIGCSQSGISEKTEFLIKFEDGSRGQVVIMSRFSSLESKEMIDEKMGITDSEGKIEFKELPVPSAYRISVFKNGERKYLVGYMFGKGAARQNHTLTIRRDGGTSGMFENKN
ncbi:MAG: hypothetical protein AAB648_01785 [Patescibacteria group bacterium]